MRLANRMSRLGTETAFEVLAAAKKKEAAGARVIHLEIGEPDFATPDGVVRAGIRAIEAGHTHYVTADGLPEVKESIAEEIARTRGFSVHPDEVVVTPGAKPILFFTLLALAESGTEVIFPDPGFPIYESMIRFCGAQPVPVTLKEELDFRFDPNDLLEKVTERTRLIILNSPNNPTGSVLSRKDLERLAEGLAGSDVVVLSDEIYSKVLYEAEHFSIAGFPGMREKTILLDGFSKSFAMTGWRLGFAVVPRALASEIRKLIINSVSCTAPFTQLAGVEAFRSAGGSTEEMVRIFRKRRDRVVELLNEIDGVSCRLPQGAFYAFPNIRSFGRGSLEVQRYLLDRADVAVLSGTAFGHAGEGYLRLSYANSIERLEEGISRIAEALGDLGSAKSSRE